MVGAPVPQYQNHEARIMRGHISFLQISHGPGGAMYIYVSEWM